MNRLLFVLIALTIAGCDCLQSLKGTVVDVNTGDPIQGAVVYKQDDESIAQTTDVEGKFELSDITGTGDCNNITVVVEKPGYNDLVLTAPNHEDIIIQLSN